MTTTMTANAKPPSLIWSLLEGRSVFEFGTFVSLRLLMKHLPKGDNHPVIVYPGFLGSAHSTAPMRNLLRDLGYHVYDWGMGRNMIFNPSREEEMHIFVREIARKHKQKVSLIGWSLGGVYVREIAKIQPRFVRQVISMGSPLTGGKHASRVRTLFEAINGKPTAETQARLEHLNDVPSVPSTSIYSKTDGIVHWHGSLQNETQISQNIQVPASHIGLGFNPLVMFVLADRLSQGENSWEKFDIKGLKKLFYKFPQLEKQSTTSATSR